MTKEENKNRIISELSKISIECKVSNWDCHNASPIDEETLKHANRFIEKLDKNNLITDNLHIIPVPDGNLSFHYTFQKPKNADFSIDFDKSTDRLLWCCHIEGMTDAFYGSVIHLEEIIPYIEKFLGIKK